MPYLFILLIHCIETVLFCAPPPQITPSLQVTTSMEQQATESSLCERNTTAGLSTQGKACDVFSAACVGLGLAV